MTPVSDGVAVVATQLAQTDRRALSEAWYSALHLAERAAHPRAAVARNGHSAPGPRAGYAIAARDETRREAAPQPARAHAAAVVRSEVRDERRRPVSVTARRIEREVRTLSARRPLPATRTVEVAGGRVRLLVHDDGRALRIVALCSVPLREHVERALASARFALAGAGLTLAAP